MQVQVSDTRLTATETFKVSLTDGTARCGRRWHTSHRTPDFSCPACPPAANDVPTLAALTIDIDEDTAVGTNVGQLVVSDVDQGDAHTFSLPTPHTKFLVTSDGKVQVNAALDYEITNMYTFQAKVVDQGNEVSTATVTVNLLDVNEAPEISDQVRSTKQPTRGCAMHRSRMCVLGPPC